MAGITRITDLAGVPQVLRDYLGQFLWGVTSGTPTAASTGVKATGAGSANIGVLIVDKTNGVLYKNTGTKAVPVWNAIGTIAASEITLAEGSVLVGNNSGVGVALDGSTTTEFLVGNGTTMTSVAMSGDATMSNAGAVTISAGAVEATMIALAEGNMFIGGSGGASEALDIGATSAGIAIGDGTTAAIFALSGDVTMSTGGVVTIGAGTVEATMIALAEGNILVGGSGGASEALDIGNTDKGIAIGNGTTAAIFALTGDVTMSNGGVTAIGADKVTEQQVLINLPVAVPIQAVIGNRGGANSDGVMVGTITHTDSADVTQEDNSGGPSYTDETADAASAGAGDVAIPDPFDTDDALYIGYGTIFSAVVIDVGTAGAGDASVAETEWQYWDGDSWEALTEVEDSSAALETGTDTYVVSFLPPADWEATTVDGGSSLFFVKFVSSADDVYNTTQPLITQIWVTPLAAGSGLQMPFDCTVTGVNMTALVNSATNDDTEILLINVSAGTFAQVTWTGGDLADAVTGLTLAFTAGQEYAVHVITEDGTTEFDGAQLQLICSVG